MPHALLLSPDDQAVSAITGVLEEMSVTCERPMDGPSAARKLTTESFDLVLVDCENLPAAKLIFDVCRRPKAGGNPVPIAIVDGRAGLPTAFRLGAELILTKPVAKDQARTTIRTAVGRVRKDEPARAVPAHEHTPAETAPLPEKSAHAAAGAFASSAPFPAMRVAPQISTPEPARMIAAVEHVPVPVASAATKAQLAAPETPAPPKGSGSSLSAPLVAMDPLKPSDDPVLADLESETDQPTPVFTAYKEPPKKKRRGVLIALFILVLAGGGFYGAWMYQPGFRETAQPEIDRLLAMAEFALPRPSAAPVQQAPPATDAPSASAQPAATTNSTSGAPVATTSLPPVLAAPTATAGTAGTSPTAPVTSPATAPSETPKTAASPEPTNSVLNVSSDSELPAEKTAVLLSSHGAENRLVHSQPPTYPAQARKEKLEGTVVLKAVIGESGRVEGVRVVEGNPTLAEAAITAIKQWRYRPYVRDGKTRPFQTIVLVDFQRP